MMECSWSLFKANHSAPQYSKSMPHLTYVEEDEDEWFHEDLQDRLELTRKKRCPFHDRGLECKSRKSRDTWSNRQVWPWSIKWNREKANRVSQREHTGHSKHDFPSTQVTSLHVDITRWSIMKSDWLCFLQPKMEKFYIVNKSMSWSRLWSYYEFLFVKFKLKLKKVGKATRPFRYDINLPTKVQQSCSDVRGGP